MLQGTRVKLRPIEFRDLKRLNSWRNDYEVFKYLGGGFNPVSIDQQQKWLDNYIDNTGNNKRFIILNENENEIGLVGLYNINYINRNCEYGMYIGEKEFWGKGYGRETTEIIINYAFNCLNLLKIKLQVVVLNTNAIKMYEKIGFQKVGYLKNERYIDGSYTDVLIMELLRENYTK